MIYSADQINAIKKILVKREETLAVAESVTAGHLQAAFSSALEASNFFQGGITAYNLGQKARHLFIDPILGDKVNCVALKIAKKMAVEVTNLFSCDYGISITGYASIVPECEEDGLFAYFSMSYRGEEVLTKRLTSTLKEPFDVQVDYTNQVMHLVLKYLVDLK